MVDSIVFKIALIDLVLAGDNAVVVGMAAARVEPGLRPKVIRWGIAGAVVIRILLAVGVTYLGGVGALPDVPLPDVPLPG